MSKDTHVAKVGTPSPRRWGLRREPSYRSWHTDRPRSGGRCRGRRAAPRRPHVTEAHAHETHQDGNRRIVPNTAPRNLFRLTRLLINFIGSSSIILKSSPYFSVRPSFVFFFRYTTLLLNEEKSLLSSCVFLPMSSKIVRFTLI